MDVAVVAPDGVRERISSALRGDGITAVAMSEKTSESAGQPVDLLVIAVIDGDEAGVETALGDARANGAASRIVLVLTDRSIQARRGIDAGADGVVWESQLEGALRATVAAVLAGQLVVPGDSRASESRPALSAREKQVLGLVVLGLTNGEIARKLYLTESTVKSHLATSFKKLGVTSRKDAVARILDPADGFGTGILSITGAERIET